MTIYIPLFWCGVGATILAEIVACVVYAVTSSKPAPKNKRRPTGDK